VQSWSPYPAPDLQPVRPRRSRAPQIITIVATALIAFSAGMVVDRTVAAQPAQQASAGAPLQGFEVYQEALKEIRANYVGRGSVTDQQLLYGSIRGMVDALGDTNHSRFLTPQEYAQMTSELSGHVAGIGIVVTQTNGQPAVDRVLTGTPADKAGVLAGDQIVAVDGKSTTGWTFDQLASAIRGTVGTSVTLSVIHPGQTTPVDLTMTRAQITAPLVDWALVPGTKIADIALFEFSDGAGKQLQQAITAAESAGATGIIFDLRGNPGGIAGEARNVASQFLSSGVIYQEEDASGKKTPVTVDTSWKATSLPMVVLVDHDTASAAEIVSGALQDNHRAKVIGLTTVGTGTVLVPFVLSDGSVLLLGVEDWLTPNGQRIFNVGITPDQKVSMPTGGQPLDPVKFGSMTAASIQSSNDAQLLAALKALGQ
jgi:carboxyl-terminal processing protease